MSKKKTENKKPSIYDKTVDVLSKKHGMTIIRRLRELKEKPEIGYSTGSLGLDYVISPNIGGMQAGKLIDLYGEFSTGKTTMALGLVANVVANGRRALFLDAENSFKWKLATDVGIDVDMLDVMDSLDARSSANALYDLISSGELGVVVIDSIAAWKPLPEGKKGDDDVDITKDKVAAQSLFLSHTLPTLCSACRDNDTLLIVINQVRKNIGGYGKEYKPFGGTSLEHQDNVRLFLSGKAAQKKPRILDSEGNIIGQWVTVECDKNKIDMPLKKVRVPLILGKGINPYMEVGELGQLVGAIDAGAGGHYRLEGQSERIAHGVDNLYQAIYDDPELFNHLRSVVIDRLGIKYSKDIVQVNPFLLERNLNE